MRKKAAVILLFVLLFAHNGFAIPAPGNTTKTDIATISVEQQYEAVRPGGESALAVRFELKKDWHFYASAATAAGGMNLKLKPISPDYISFSEPLFPRPHSYFDKYLRKKLDVFSGTFTVFLPFTVSRTYPSRPQEAGTLIQISIEGAVCSATQCSVPDFGRLGTAVRISSDASMSEPKFVLPDLTQPSQWAGYSVWFALGLAFLAGLSLNIMPCVWPVLPLIVMRIVEQANQGKRKWITLGLAFCAGILLFFFAFLAGPNIILRLFYGTVLQWGDPFRSPVFVGGMALFLVVLALFMFGVFTISVPSSIAGKSGSGKGYAGAVGMGFLAAVLSTPCGFGILAAAFGWAQTQPLFLATVAIMIMGVGMAAPYAILTSMPGFLKRLPKAGRWMELFKQTVGFVLLGIAIWLISALPAGVRIHVLYFAVVLSFCVWMWGGWVGYNTKTLRKVLIRTIAVVLAVLAGLTFLIEGAASTERIDWQPYDANLIASAKAEGRAVLIKFTADWCLSCKVVEKTVYADEEISRLVREKNVLPIKGDTTGTGRNYPATFALKNIYKEPAVPVSILFLPGRQEPLRWRGKSFVGELKELLEKLPSKQ